MSAAIVSFWVSLLLTRILLDQPFPMRDDSGKRAGGREINDHRTIVAGLRETATELAARPEDLALA